MRSFLGYRLARVPDAIVERVTARRPVMVAGQRLEARTQHVLRLLDGASTPLHQLPVSAARREYLEFPRIFDGPPISLSHVDERTIPGPQTAVPVRIYRPHGETKPSPALLYFHGGGGVIGSRDTHDGLCRALCRNLCAVVISVDYRLAPEHPFPAGLDDAFAAFQWLVEEGPSLGVDPNAVAVGGDSLGGNLAAVVCQLARAGVGRLPAAQLLLYPATDVAAKAPSHRLFAEGFLLTETLIDWFMDHYLAGADRHDPRCSPLRADDLTGLPPAVIVTAGFDPLRDEGQAYAEALREAGVPVSYRCCDGLVHGFAQMTGVVEPAQQAIFDASRQLQAFLRGS